MRSINVCLLTQYTHQSKNMLERCSLYLGHLVKRYDTSINHQNRPMPTFRAFHGFQSLNTFQVFIYNDVSCQVLHNETVINYAKVTVMELISHVPLCCTVTGISCSSYPGKSCHQLLLHDMETLPQIHQNKITKLNRKNMIWTLYQPLVVQLLPNVYYAMLPRKKCVCFKILVMYMHTKRRYISRRNIHISRQIQNNRVTSYW